MGHDVFISYSSQDQNVADQIVDALEKNNIRCWIAHRDITPGLFYPAAITKAIRESRVMVLVFSAASNASNEVPRELVAAAGLVILPFSIENTPPSDNIKHYTGSSHWLNAFEGDIEVHIKRLVRALHQLLEHEQGSIPETITLDTAAGSLKTSSAPGAGIANEFERQLASVNELMKTGDWCEAVRICGKTLEIAMKKLLKEALSNEDNSRLLNKVLSVEQDIGDEERSVDQYSIKEIVYIYLQTDILGALRKRMASSLKNIECIDWEQLMSCCDKADSRSDSKCITREDAVKIASWTKLFLEDCELIGEKYDVPPVPEAARNPAACPSCGNGVKSDWEYCPACGGKIRLVCHSCNRALAPAFRICPYCETKVRRNDEKDDEHQNAIEEYRAICEGAYIDGVVNMAEREVLNNKRLVLGLSVREAAEIERECAPANVVEYTRLVEGVLVNHVIDESERSFLDNKAKKLGISKWLALEIEKVAMHICKETSDADDSAGGS